MTEQFLHYLWKNRLYDNASLISDEGLPVRIISPGQYSVDAGPDFTHAKIYIGNTLWVGNVEIHLRASDWYKHNHQNDKAYDNVILHVVYTNDRPVRRTNKTLIPAISLTFDPQLLERYTYLQMAPHKVACEAYLPNINRFFIDNWLDRLLAERLALKATQIKVLFTQNNHDLHETFYQLLFRNFGFKTNALPMEQLARSLPYRIIRKQSDNRNQIEALLFGQAGLLEANHTDEYFQTLQREWFFLQKKYTLQPIDGHVWKFMRLRPANFPTIRLAQLAGILEKNSDLLAVVNLSAEALRSALAVDVSPYWKTHYTFGSESRKTEKNTGNEAIQNVIINTIAPWLFFYGQLKSKQKYMDRALDLLEKTPAERNTIINYWNDLGINALHAAQSQSLLQLYNAYCKPRGCLFCHIGNLVLTNSS